VLGESFVLDKWKGKRRRKKWGNGTGCPKIKWLGPNESLPVADGEGLRKNL